MGSGEGDQSVLDAEDGKGATDVCSLPHSYTSAFPYIAVYWASPLQAPKDKDTVS